MAGHTVPLQILRGMTGPILLVCLIACDGRMVDRSGFEVRDSAGVEIVENHAPVWAEGEGWRVEVEPVLRLGVVEGDPAQQFDRIAAVFRMEDGRIVVVNGGTGELRFFAADGAFLHSTGREGGGPGEFTRLRPFTIGSFGLAGPWPADSIFVHDMNAGRLQIFDSRGDHARELRTPDIRRNWMRGPTPDGHFVLTTNTGDTGVPSEDGWQRENLMVLDAKTGTVDTVGFVPLYRGGVFPHVGVSEAGHGGIYLARNDRFEFRQVDSLGQPTRLVRRAYDPVEVTPAIWEEYVEYQVERQAGDDVDAATRIRQRNAEIPEGAYLPAFSHLLADRGGNLWIRHYGFGFYGSPPRAWDVFDPSGRWLGQAEMPEAVHIAEIGDDYVLGVVQDDLDVEYVVMHRLLK